MHIAILDGHTLNPGDLSWDGLRALGTVTLHPRTPAGEIVPRAADAEVIVTNKVPLSAATLALLPRLKLIAVTATGYNIVDTAAAGARGVAVCNVPAYSTASVAQMTFALLLELASRVAEHAASVRAGEWARSPDFAYTKGPLVELAGKTLGIVGFGTIGRQVGQVAQALGMNLAVAVRPGRPAPALPARGVDIETLFATSDVVSLHCPLTPENAGFVNAALLARMKPSAFLVNTARGGLVVERDLAAALNAGTLAGFAADVLSVEPPPAENPLLSARNCVLTPHIAWATLEARRRCMAVTVENVAAFFRGKAVNVVNA